MLRLGRDGEDGGGVGGAREIECLLRLLCVLLRVGECRVERIDERMAFVYLVLELTALRGRAREQTAQLGVFALHRIQPLQQPHPKHRIHPTGPLLACVLGGRGVLPCEVRTTWFKAYRFGAQAQHLIATLVRLERRTQLCHVLAQLCIRRSECRRSRRDRRHGGEPRIAQCNVRLAAARRVP